MSASNPVFTRRHAPARNVHPLPSCATCPVCGTDECLVLEELGTYCLTMTSAQLASAEPPPPPAGEEGAAA